MKVKCTNKNYQKGRRKEYTITDRLKKEGFEIAQRTAGSHSPIDIVAINKETKEIKFIQVKVGEISYTEHTKIHKEMEWLNKGKFEVSFEIAD